ncbi:20230_t:CDS:1, partial [Gigaspora margarita]
IITNELLVVLNLHIRQKKKFPSPVCPRYKNEIEDGKYWLCCKKKRNSVREVIQKSLNEMTKKKNETKKIHLTQAQKQDYKEMYMAMYFDPNTNVKIGIITKDCELMIEGKN